MKSSAQGGADVHFARRRRPKWARRELCGRTGVPLNSRSVGADRCREGSTVRDLRLLALYLLFFASGLSGLVYQVIWVRQLGLVFGNTLGSASLVTAVFMSGLGVGSYLAGRWIDAAHARSPTLPLRAYGIFELGIATLGVGLAVALPVLQEWTPVLADYRVDAGGWHVLSAGSRLVQYGLATVLLLPSTLLMGGTLTLLIRLLLVSDLKAAGWRTGVL